MTIRKITSEELLNLCQRVEETDGVELVGAGWNFQMRPVVLTKDKYGHTHLVCENTYVDVDMSGERVNYELHDDNSIWIWQWGSFECNIFVIERHPLEKFGIFSENEREVVS